MNRISILAIILVTVIFAAAWAQVDTLMLVEIGSIQAPSEITELYVEDLNGDSLKEIIICTDSYVYIYDSQTYQVQWTSLPLNHPTDLLFEDINGDGLIDLSVKDSANIHLFDPHTPQTIWTSPPLDSTYKCYTIGDRNGDDWIDVAIVSKEWFTRYGIEYNTDSIWIDIHNGPDFISQDQMLLLMMNYSIGNSGDSYTVSEIPALIYISDFVGINGNTSLIILFTDVEASSTGPMQSYSNSTLGNIWLINAEYFYLNYVEGCGQLLEFRKIDYNNFTLLHTLGHRYDRYGWMYGDGRNRYKYVNTYSIDSLLSSSIVWGYVNGGGGDWNGYVIGDINDISPDEEIYFLTYPNHTLASFPQLDTLWLSNAAGIVQYACSDNIIFSNPQIINKLTNPSTVFHFYSGFDGSLSAVLPNFGFVLSQVSDLNNDQRDEILSIQGTSLYIYNLDYATGIEVSTRLPQSAFLRSNYPNPFNSSTTIEYGLLEAGRVRIDIYNLLGRRVETLVDEDMQPGRHRVVWDASGYSSGVYFYRIETSDFIDTKRMVYLK
jgi:hypothetical protein